MSVPRKQIMLYNVAVMEPPATSSDHESSYDFFDSIHSAHARVGGAPPLYGGGGGGGHSQQQPSSPLSLVPTAVETASSKHSHKHRVLSTLTLVGIVYFASCGGPVGSEPLISTGGPLLGLVGVGVYVLLCVLPLSFMITELCCAFPENGGHAVWAMTAFDPFWGFQSGYWSWVGSVLNNAIYPGIIYSTLAGAYGVEATSTVVEFFIKVAFAVVLAIPSYIGVRFVGVSALVMLVFVMTSVAVLALWSAVESDGAWFRLAEVRAADEWNPESETVGVDWTLLIHTLFWSFDGTFSVSVIGGEVLNPARTFPRVMAMTVACSVVTYMLPWLFVLAADKTPWREMTEDSLSDVADAIGGSVLHQLMLITATLGSMGLFSCTMFFQSFLVQGMAQSGMLPVILRKRSARFKTPQYALLLSLLTTVALVGFDFESILNMTNAFSGALQLLMVLSMLQLRRAFPYLPRPVKMPGHWLVIAIVLLPVMAVYVFLIVTTLMELKLALIVAAFAVPGLLYPIVRQRLAGRHFGWC